MAPRVRAAANAAVVTDWGISNSPTTTSSGARARTAAAASAGTIASFAPATQMIRFVPSGSTQIGATPLDPVTRVTKRVSMPSSAKLRIVMSPKTSSPSALTIATSAPRRRAMTAWFAPFPPNPRRKSSPAMVSPPDGTRWVYAIRSIIVLPTTAMRGAVMLATILAARSGGRRAHLPGRPPVHLPGTRVERGTRGAAPGRRARGVRPPGEPGRRADRAGDLPQGSRGPRPGGYRRGDHGRRGSGLRHVLGVRVRLRERQDGRPVPERLPGLGRRARHPLQRHAHRRGRRPHRARAGLAGRGRGRHPHEAREPLESRSGRPAAARVCSGSSPWDGNGRSIVG